jgi:hypothetical protein
MITRRLDSEQAALTPQARCCNPIPRSALRGVAPCRPSPLDDVGSMFVQGSFATGSSQRKAGRVISACLRTIRQTEMNILFRQRSSGFRLSLASIVAVGIEYTAEDVSRRRRDERNLRSRRGPGSFAGTTVRTAITSHRRRKRLRACHGPGVAIARIAGALDQFTRAQRRIELRK